MKRLLLDTNIYISAIFFGGKPKEIIELARVGKIDLVISEYILWEIREVLRRKFKAPDSKLNIIERDILSIAKVIKTPLRFDVVSRDPADNAILAGAVEGRVDAIVTGDNDLLVLKKYNNLLIMTPAEYLRRIKH